MDILGIQSAQHLLWCFAAGFMVACVYAFYVKCVTGKLVRTLAREDACDEGSALTLKEIGCSSGVYRFALRKGTSLSESIVAANPDEAEKRYYIKPEAKEKLLSKYGANSRGLLSLILTLLAALVAACVGAMMLPFVTDYFDKIM